MAYRIVWTRSAIRRLQGIYNYFFEHASGPAADKIVDGIIDRANQLESFPDSGLLSKLLKNIKGSIVI